LKTKTRVEAFDDEIEENEQDVPKDLLKIFTKKGQRYVTALNQKLIDKLHKYFD